ncbi:MAG: DegV family protein [Lactobacillus equicursoris]|uniref:DegV family protein n=1 Tax=Lactobacillus equicursoris TaxID=420645 RepID=UPI0024307F9B|nr:DegV family protein [Lactobacillus equicursoris]MDD6407464.1 DegV family protein [Lactobacillus equicursoris]
MEKVRLILDSSSNILSDPARNLVVVPLTLTFGEENMLDDEKLDISEFLAKMEANNEAGKTAAPSIQRWLDALEGSENAIIVTLTSGLSGTYSSALQAKDIYLEQHPHANVIVVDSRSAGPELEVVLEGIEALIKDDKLRFADLEAKIAEFRTRTHLLFVLQSLRNLSLNGRVSPAVAKIAGVLKINLIGTASVDGELQPLTKARGMKKALREIVKQMEGMKYQGGRVVIDECENATDAEKLKEAILASYPDADVTIRPMRGLCSFYAERGGLMIGFHE